MSASTVVVPVPRMPRTVAWTALALPRTVDDVVVVGGGGGNSPPSCATLAAGQISKPANTRTTAADAERC